MRCSTRSCSPQHGLVFARDDWDQSFARVQTPNGRIQLAVRELFDELAGLAGESAPGPIAEYPLVLSAGERRSYTANTIIRDPDWRRKDRDGALRIHPEDALRAGLDDGGWALLSTRRGALRVRVEVSNRMQPGHVSLPNGQGVDYVDDSGRPSRTGAAPNELTDGRDRDWFAGTPWHKYVPARVEAVSDTPAT